MFRSIKSWLNKRRLLRYALRKAVEADIDFVMDQIISGAKEGHFIRRLAEKSEQENLRRSLSGVITLNVLTVLSERGVEKIKSKLWIYGAREDDSVGFLLVSQKQMGSDVVELYQTSVRKSHRSGGHGKRIVQLFIMLAAPDAVLYARCYKQSDAMFHILIEHGFQHVGTTANETRELHLVKKGWPTLSNETLL